jgi:hypothetical protein
MNRSFKQYYLEEAAKETVTLNFGRFNPPTIGHQKLLDVSMSKGTGVHRVYATQSIDKNKNPLPYLTKVKFMRKMFPKHARHILMDRKVKTIFDALVIAYEDGYKHLELFVGSDRVLEFEKLVEKYHGKKARHGFYEFESVKVISAGERDPDSDGADGMSASKMRAAAKDNDLISFTKGVPKNWRDAKNLMTAVRDGMGLSESSDYKQKVVLKRKSYIREVYVKGDLFSVGDEVVITKTREAAIIQKLYPNSIGVLVNNEMKNVWLSDIVRRK